MSNLKIVFAVPPYHMNGQHVPNGVSIVATMAKNAGYDVRVYSASERSENISEFNTFNKGLLQYCVSNCIDVVAVGAMSMHYMPIKTLINVLRSAWTGKIILGGYIVDSSQEIVPMNIGADICVYGEGEYTFLELAKALESGTNLKDINGLIYKENDYLVKTSPRKPVKDLDSLPFIDGELVHLRESLAAGGGFP